MHLGYGVSTLAYSSSFIVGPDKEPLCSRLDSTPARLRREPGGQHAPGSWLDLNVNRVGAEPNQKRALMGECATRPSSLMPPTFRKAPRPVAEPSGPRLPEGPVGSRTCARCA